MSKSVFKQCREAKGVSQGKMAYDLGISKDYIYLIESKKRKPALAMAKKMADYLGTTMDNLFFQD